jgi:hypothetical protein
MAIFHVPATDMEFLSFIAEAAYEYDAAVRQMATS